MFEEQQKQLAKEFGVSAVESKNEWFQIKEGNQKVRILSVGKLFPQYFDAKTKKGYICVGEENGCPSIKAGIKPSIKWMTRVYDYEDNQIKIAKLPYGVNKQVSALQQDPDWSFDEMPMPYDITLKTKGAGTKEVEYSVVPSPKRVDLPENVMSELADLKDVEEIVEAMKQKRIRELSGNEAPAYPTEESEGIRHEDRPF